MNIEQIEDAVVSWIQALGMTPIIAYPGAGRPTTSYVLINILTDTQIGTEEDNGETIPIYSSFNQITLSLNTYYTGAFQNAISIKKSLMTLEIKELLWDAGLGFSTATDIQKIPEEIDNVWEERAQFDIVFNVRETTETENIGEILKVQLTNEIDNTTTTIGD